MQNLRYNTIYYTKLVHAFLTALYRIIKYEKVIQTIIIIIDFITSHKFTMKLDDIKIEDHVQNNIN